MAEAFSQRLLEVLRDKRISQTRVAGELSVSRTAVNKWTRGGSIDDSNLERLANYLEVDKLWLKYGVNTETSVNPAPVQQQNISEVHLHGSSDIVTWEWDLLANKVAYSENAERVYGVRINSNEDFWGLMSPESRQKLESDYGKIIREGGAHEMDFCIVKDNVPRWIASRAVGVRDQNGKITRIIGISMDNTTRKEYELSLQRNEQFFRLLLARCKTLIVFTDVFGEILASNQERFSDQISYLALQQQLYRLVSDHPERVEEATPEPECRVTVGEKAAVLTRQPAEGEQQSYLMFEFL